MSAKLSLILGAIGVVAWCYLILIKRVPAGWPHALYAIGVMLIIRWIALRDGGALTS
jgi:hypothetical protein